MKRSLFSHAALAAGTAAAVATLVGSQVANANLISNGNFATNASSYTTDYGYDYNAQTGNTNPANPTDWSPVSTGGVNGTNTSYQTFGPSSPTELNGTSSTIADYAFVQDGGGFTQTFSVVAGTTYSLTYDAAARNQSSSIGTSTAPAGIIATVTDPNSTVIYKQTSNFTNATEFYSNDNAGGNYFTTNTGSGLDFTAVTTGLATLEFLDYGNSSDYSADFTNVAVTAVPEPASLGLLGIGGLGLLLLGKRGKTA
ncbi:MAG: PEP-CTERM sorting domain-containing protein [Phycisphaerae bacterium]